MTQFSHVLFLSEVLQRCLAPIGFWKDWRVSSHIHVMVHCRIVQCKLCKKGKKEKLWVVHTHQERVYHFIYMYKKVWQLKLEKLQNFHW